MKKVLIGMLVILLSTSAFADIFYFKNGVKLENCREISRDDTRVYIEYVSDGKVIKGNIFISTIDHVEPSIFDPAKESKRYNIKGEDITPKVVIQPEIVSEYEPKYSLNYKMLPISLAVFVIGIDYIQSANSIKDEINNYRIASEAIKKIGGDYHFYTNMIKTLEDKQKNLMTKGIIITGGSLINIVFAFEKIEAKPINNGIKLSYKF
jgi:hypothetical protein